jgi:hypothetical protein
VSPLWRDEIGVYLSPQRACLVRMTRGLRPQLARHDEIKLSGQSEEGEWETAIAALNALIGTDPWGEARVRVILGDHWVRYVVVPWSSALNAGAERLAHARQLLAATYGDPISDWTVCLADAPPLAPRVACAMPPMLLQGIRAACAKRGVHLVSVQPHLIAAYNRWRAALPAAGGWFVTIDHGSLAAARLAESGWDRVHTVRIGTDWARELRRLKTFGRLASTTTGEGQVYVDAPQAWREVAGEAGSDLNWLEESGAALPTTLHQLARVWRLAA